MLFYIILLIVLYISVYFYIKLWLDYKYRGTFPIQIKIIEIQKLYFVSIIFYIFGYKVYEIQGEGQKGLYNILVVVKSNRKFKKDDEIKILKINKNNYIGEQI